MIPGQTAVSTYIALGRLGTESLFGQALCLSLRLMEKGRPSHFLYLWASTGTSPLRSHVSILGLLGGD